MRAFFRLFSLLLHSKLLSLVVCRSFSSENNFFLLSKFEFKTISSWTTLSIIDSTKPSFLIEFQKTFRSESQVSRSSDFLAEIPSFCLPLSFYSSLPKSSFYIILYMTESLQEKLSLCSTQDFRAYLVETSIKTLPESIQLSKSLIFQESPTPESSAIVLISENSRFLNSEPCEDYYSVLDKGTCEPCINGCLKCSNSTTCDQCFRGSGSNYGYYLKSDMTCEFCKWYECSTCIDSTRCEVCNSDYYRTDDYKCLPCPSNCEQCSSASQCIKCKSEYFMSSTGSCESCIVMCDICSDSKTCSVCREYFFLVPSRDTCEQCGFKCLTCTDKSTCLTCEDGFISIKGSCEVCGEQCLKCNTYRTCSECNAGFYLDHSFVCQPCSDPFCEICPNGLCYKCKTGYIKSFGQCKKCPDGCKICDDSGICKQCLLGPLINGACLVCGNHCNNCDDVKCFHCDSGYFYLSGKDCTKCSNNCLDCDSKGCTRCVDKFYAVGNDCFSCSPHCISCDKLEVCSKCEESFMLKANVDESGYVFCHPCIANCSTCFEENTCSVCKIGFVVNEDGKCESCGKGCLSCVNDFCISCTDQYFFDPLQKACLKCTEFCITCTNTSNCQFCKVGYYWNPEALACYKCSHMCLDCIQDQCNSCYLGFYLSSINSCSVCKEGCFDCKDYEKCKKCSDGYFLDLFTEACNLCISNCEICSSGSTCEKCSKGFYIKQNKCTACPSHCLDCDIDTTCYECGKGTYLNSGKCLNCDPKCSSCDSLDICTSCNKTFYLNSTQCFSCYENCDICQNPLSCQKCRNGFSIEKSSNSSNGQDNICVKCDDGCLDCESGICFKCMDRHMMDKHKCIECPENCIWCYSFFNPLTRATSYYCGWCFNGFLLDQPGCKDCGKNCLDCDHIGCLKCEDGFFIDEFETCTKCSPYCLDCFDLSFCWVCDQNYNLNWGTGLCSDCPSMCLECDINEKCVLCEDYYYIDSAGLCEACGNHCITCTKDDCIECDVGLYVDKFGDCDICKVGCSQCESKEICKECQDGFYLERVSDTLAICLTCGTGCLICEASACKVCKESFYLDKITELCVSCSVKIPGCSWCSNPKKCETCSVGYALDSDFFCRRCRNGCVDCVIEYFNDTSVEICKACNSSFFLLDGSCKKCPENCLKCGDADTCHLCEKLYFIDSFFQCSACPKNCVSCREKSVCDKCSSGFYWDSVTLKCLNCESGCLTCSSTTCSICKSGLFLDSKTARCEFCTSHCNHCLSLDYCIECQAEYFFDDKLSKCMQCPANCQECSSATECYSCYAGFMNSAGLCSSCPKNCEICKTTGCVSCFERFFLLDNTCTECPNNCLHCESSSKCIVCEAGYFNTSSHSCEKCEANCLSCTQGKCLICMDGFFKSNNSCSLCPQNCKNCAAGFICEYCYQGFFANKKTGLCQPCTDPGCEICSSESSCDSCKSGLLRNTNGICAKCPDFCVECDHGNKCLKCLQGRFADSRTGMCFKCPVYCEDCNSFTNCKKCANNFITTANGTCVPCMRDCLSCESATTCRKCDKGSFLNITSQCARCNKGCVHCSKLENCFECDFKLFLTDSLCRPCTDVNCFQCPGNKCKQCIQGFFLNSELICTRCSKDCLDCTDLKNCKTCRAGYFLVENGSKCDNCKIFCSSCSSITQCLTCQSGFYLNSDASPDVCEGCPLMCETCLSNVCYKCVTGYYLGFTGLCWDCARGCETCQTDQVCDKCQEGFYLTGLAACLQCVSPCIKCLNDKICQACKARFKLSPDLTCDPCPEGCEICDDLSRCFACSTGYVLEDSSCFACSSTDVISAVVSSDFKSLEILFSSVIDSGRTTCSKSILTNDTFGLGWTCSFKEKTLKITFGSRFLIDEYSNISIFTDLVFLRPCTVKQTHVLRPSFKTSPPVPSGVLKGSTHSSLLCENSKLEYYIDNVQGTFELEPVVSWSATATVANPEVSNALQKMKETRINIPISMFIQKNTQLNVKAEIFNCFRRSAVLELNTSLVMIRKITVSTDSGRFFQAPTSKKLEIKAKVLETCGSLKNFSYSWNLTSTTNPRAKLSDFNLKLNERVLKIPKDTLRPFFQYEFTITVTSGQLVGSDLVLIDGKADDLVVVFDRKSGQVPTAYELIINASKSYDPNKLSENLNFYWSCLFPNNRQCRTKDNDPLTYPGKNEPVFVIPSNKLKTNKNYQIILTLSTSTDNRLTTSSLNLNTEENISTDIKIFMDSKKVEPSKRSEIYYKVNSTTQFSLSWNQVSGPRTDINTSNINDLNYLSIPAFTFKYGETYEFKLTAFEYTSLLYPSSSITFKTNMRPECLEDLSINKWSGYAYRDEFSLAIQPCVDPDEDYPLKYEFYLKPRSKKIDSLCKPSYSNNLNFLLTESETYSAYVKVYDQLGGFNTLNLPKYFFVDVLSRTLETQDPVSLYLEVTQSYQDLKAFYAVSFIESFKLEPEQVEIIYQDCLQSSRNTEIDLYELEMMIKVISAIVKTQKSSLNYEKIEEYSEVLTQLGKNCTEELTEDVIEKIWQVSTNIVKAGQSKESFVILAKKLADNFGRIYSKNKLPGSVFFNFTDSDMTFFKKREICGNIKEETFNLPRNISVFIESLPFHSSDLIDINLKTFTSADSYSDLIEITFTKSGSYQTKEVIIEDERILKLNDSTVLFEVPILKDSSKIWTCEVFEKDSWKNEACIIDSFKNDSVKFRISHTSLYRLSVMTDYRDIASNYPVSLIIIILLLFIVLVYGLYLNCRRSEKIQSSGETNNSGKIEEEKPEKMSQSHKEENKESDKARLVKSYPPPRKRKESNADPSYTIDGHHIDPPNIEQWTCFKKFWNNNQLNNGEKLIGKVFVLFAQLWFQLGFIKKYNINKFNGISITALVFGSTVFAVFLQLLVLIISKLGQSFKKNSNSNRLRYLLLIIVFGLLAGVISWSVLISIDFILDDIIVVTVFSIGAVIQLIINRFVLKLLQKLLRSNRVHEFNVSEL